MSRKDEVAVPGNVGWSGRVMRYAIAADPGRVRFHNAVAASGAVAASAVISLVFLRTTSVASDLLVLSSFMTLMSILMAKDSTPRGRLLTTLLMLPVAVTTVVVTMLLSQHRLVAVALFVLLAGMSVWLRRFGTHASGAGTIAVFACFFVLVLRISPDELGWTCVAMSIGVGSAIVMRALRVRQRPLSDLRLLVREFRSAASGAVDLAALGNIGNKRNVPLKHLDDVALAISTWTGDNDPRAVLGVKAQDLSEVVFASRVGINRICRDFATLPEGSRSNPSVDLLTGDLQRVLRAPLDDVESKQAKTRAEKVLARTDVADEISLVEVLIARNILNQLRLWEIVASAAPTHPVPTPQSIPESSPDDVPESSMSAPFPWWAPWRRWAPSTRLALQVSIAAALAAVVGEWISASRWYWALLAAFTIFTGVTSRGAILTRAWRRVAGTVVGVLLGVVLVFVVSGNHVAMVVIIVVCVFLAVYLAPVNYGFMVAAITVMLAAMYTLLGVFYLGLLEIRIAETLAGVAIGSVCAYLVFSTSSAPELRAATDDYFAALEDLIDQVEALLTGGDASPSDVLAAVSRLDSCDDRISTVVSSTTATFISTRRSLMHGSLSIMGSVTHSGDRLAQAAMSLVNRHRESSRASDPLVTADYSVALTRAVAQVREDIDDTKRALRSYSAMNRRERVKSGVSHVASGRYWESRWSTDTEAAPASGEAAVLDLFQEVTIRLNSPQFGVVVEMSRLDWALREMPRLSDRILR